MRSQLSKDEFTQFLLKPRENNFFVSCLNWRFLSWLGQSFKESFRGGNLFKNLAIFWMNKKTIIVFGFCMMWRIVQILGGCYPPRPSASVDNILLICRILKVARYSFSGPIPSTFEHKLRRQKTKFWKNCTVVLDKDENLLWSGLQWNRSCRSNEMTLLPILLTAVYLGTGNCSSKIVHGSFFL